MEYISPVLQNLLSIPLLLSLVLALACIPILKRISVFIGLIDHPGGRKQHASPIPLVGGPALFFAITVVIFSTGIPQGFEGLTIGALAIFILGLFDDKFDLPAKLRLALQTAIVTYALTMDSIWIGNLVSISDYTFGLGIISYPLTIIAILAIMNAINMLDGLDGLSSGIVLIILGSIISFASIANNTGVALFATIIFGAVLGFWAFNYRFKWRTKASIFMGDSGTTLLGFALPYLAIKLTVGENPSVNTPLLLWFFAIPVFDLISVIIRRVREGRSPMQAGRDHLHHIMLNAGFSVRQTVHLIYILTAGTIAVGASFTLFNLTQIELYLSFVVFLGFYLSGLNSIAQNQKITASIIELNKNSIDKKDAA